MICSSEYSFDENSVWNPKAIRQLLIISEEQLNILNNIPEWTKEKDDNYYSRINDSCNTQVELNPGNTLLRNQEIINRNIELFNKNFNSRENIIQAYKLNALKFSKSISLFEINKISSNLSCVNLLSSASSLPNLSLFSKFESKSYLFERSDLSTQLNSSILNSGKSKTYIENPNMEVVSQLPAVVVPQVVKNNENFAIVDKTILSESQTSNNSSNSSDLLSTLVEVNESDNLSSIAAEKTNLVEIDKLDSGDENVASDESKQIIVSNNNNLDLQENPTKLVEPTDLKLSEEMETNSSIVRESTVNNKCIHDASEKIKLSELEDLNVNEKNELQVTVEENVINNVSSLDKDKNSNIDVEGKVLNDVKETSVEISKQPSGDPKLCESKVNMVSSDKLKIKITDSSYDSRMNSEIVFKTACQGAGDGKAVTTQNLPLKRKSEPKPRASKRTKVSKDKQVCSDERSIKKAGKICYSAEDTKIIFDLLKLFL